MIETRHLLFLKSLGVDKVRHSNRTLLDHLSGTYSLLSRWGNPRSVCLVGLFHSIYGTRTFQSRTLDWDQRDRIRRRLGREVEEMVYLFAVAERDSFFTQLGRTRPVLTNQVTGSFLPVSAARLRCLAEIEVANIVEQVPKRTRISKATWTTYRDQCERARDHITRRAYRHYQWVFANYTQIRHLAR